MLLHFKNDFFEKQLIALQCPISPSQFPSAHILLINSDTLVCFFSVEAKNKTYNEQSWISQEVQLRLSLGLLLICKSVHGSASLGA